MELKDLIILFKNQVKVIVVTAVVFGILGFLFHLFFPITYKAVGSFYVSRGVEEERLDFTYEGYYAQQAGTNYTSTFISFFESYDILEKVLKELGEEASVKNFRKLTRNIDLKRTAPQLITLTVKAKSADKADEIYKLLSKEVMFVSQTLNEESGDSLFSVSSLSNKPVVYESYRNVYLSTFAGLAFGAILGVFISVMRKYLF